MKNRLTLKFGDERAVLIRLTALWALTEAGLGGLMHLFRSPFTGIFVGGSAVLLIALIGGVARRPGIAIPKALILVLIIKLTVSPHSPLPAYVAVSFQGLVGALLFSWMSSFRLAAFLLGVLALVESALQKLLTLTLFFGMSVWEALDSFIDHTLKKFGLITQGAETQGSLWIVGVYVGVYLVAGMVVGWLAGRLPKELNAAQERLTLPNMGDVDPAAEGARRRRSWWQSRPVQWLAGIALLVGAVYFWVPGAKEVVSPLWLLVRVAVLLVCWFLIIAPLLMKLLQRYLRRKAGEHREDVDAALALLPAFRKLVRSAWRETKGLNGIGRVKEFAIRSITYALLYTGEKTDYEGS